MTDKRHISFEKQMNSTWIFQMFVETVLPSSVLTINAVANETNSDLDRVRRMHCRMCFVYSARLQCERHWILHIGILHCTQASEHPCEVDLHTSVGLLCLVVYGNWEMHATDKAFRHMNDRVTSPRYNICDVIMRNFSRFFFDANSSDRYDGQPRLCDNRRRFAWNLRHGSNALPLGLRAHNQ